MTKLTITVTFYLNPVLPICSLQSRHRYSFVVHVLILFWKASEVFSFREFGISSQIFGANEERVSLSLYTVFCRFSFLSFTNNLSLSKLKFEVLYKPILEPFRVSCSMYLLWNIHVKEQYEKWDVTKAFISALRLLCSIYLQILVKACNFLLAILQSWLT